MSQAYDTQASTDATSLAGGDFSSKRYADCYTCTALGRVCDRQRPLCRTCLSQGTECSGFSTTLSWDKSRMWLGKPTGKSSRSFAAGVSKESSRVSDATPPPATTTKPTRTFRFILGPLSKRRKLRSEGDPDARQQQNHTRQSGDMLEEDQTDEFPSVDQDVGFADNIDQQRSSPPDQPQYAFEEGEDVDFAAVDQDLGLVENNDLFVDENSFNSSPSCKFPESLDILSAGSSENFQCPGMDQPTAGAIAGELPDPTHHQPEISAQDVNGIMLNPMPSSLDPEDDSLHEVSDQDTIALDVHELVNDTYPQSLDNQEFLVPAPVSVFELQYETLIKMYDSVFCVLPLTSDMKVNPFRSRKGVFFSKSNLLAHAVLALACQHLHHSTGSPPTEAVEHRAQADNLLQVALQTPIKVDLGLDVLDAILIMFTQDCTLSALGTWSTHLCRALAVLNTCGGISILESTRVQSQVAMLIWWDATLALISRQGLTFDKSYMYHLLQLEKKHTWSFFGISGCPGQLLKCVVELADLAKQAEIAASMRWLTFDLTPVLAIEQQLLEMNCALLVENTREIHEGEKSEKEEEEDFHVYKDNVHCAETWRLALLMYIERVFKWDRSSPRPASLKRLMRSLFDCVLSCRRTSQTQKQMLLPIFLAGSEALTDDMRQLVLDYCGWWTQRSQYYMFHTVSSLLEEIWSLSKDGRSDLWWGWMIDEKTKPHQEGQSRVQFLFG